MGGACKSMQACLGDSFLTPWAISLKNIKGIPCLDHISG